jgi:hypothetical protein
MPRGALWHSGPKSALFFRAYAQSFCGKKYECDSLLTPGLNERSTSEIPQTSFRFPATASAYPVSPSLLRGISKKHDTGTL